MTPATDAPGVVIALSNPITIGIRAVFDRIDPAIWPHLSVGSTSVLPFAPIYGLATAATLVLAHLATRALYLHVGPGDPPVGRESPAAGESTTAAI